MNELIFLIPIIIIAVVIIIGANLKFTVKFETNGADNGIRDTRVKRRKFVPSPDAIYKSRCTFVGWYSDPNHHFLWDFDNDKVTRHLVLYAKWEVKPIHIVYDQYGNTAYTIFEINGLFIVENMLFEIINFETFADAILFTSHRMDSKVNVSFDVLP